MITVTKITKTCEACPAQWEGYTSDGQAVYVWYRWGYLSVDVAPTLDEAIDGTETSSIMAKQHGDMMDGYMQYDELKEITAGLVVWPKVET